MERPTIKIDDYDRCVYLGNSEIDLTKTEFEVLNFLLKHGRRTGCEIAHGIRPGWQNTGSDVATLMKWHIKHLRDKGVPISTKRGFGYRIEADPVEVQHA